MRYFSRQEHHTALRPPIKICKLDEDAAEAHRVDPTGFPPLLRRNDGAFTNW